MKKSWLVLCALTITIAVMAAGYAFWTDQLVINNSLETGNFNVEFVQVDGFLPSSITDDGTEANYLRSSINQDDPKTTTITLENMYPGSEGDFFAKIENKGSIPAMFDTASIHFDSANTNQELKDNLWTVAGYYLFDKDGNSKGENWDCATNLDELQPMLTRLFANLRLEPGDYILLDVPQEAHERIKQLVPGYQPTEGHSIHFILPFDVDNSKNAELKGAKFDMTINWKQHNS